MKNVTLSIAEWNAVLESLKYSRKKFEDYTDYPSQDYKQKRVSEMNELIIKIKSSLKGE